MKQILNQTFDKERSLYNLINAEVINCTGEILIRNKEIEKIA